MVEKMETPLLTERKLGYAGGMWIAFRLILVFIATVYRLSGFRLRKLTFTQRANGLLVHERIRTLRGGGKLIELAIPIRTKVFFKITPESRWTRLCKRLGLGNELQVGVPEFDDFFYVASDHPAFLVSLRDRPGFRTALLKMRDLGFQDVYSDGRGILYWRSNRIASETAESESGASDECFSLIQSVKETLEDHQISFAQIDPFHRAIAVFELTVFAVLSYGVAAYLEMHVDRGLPSLDPLKLLPLAGVAMAGVIGAWFLVVGFVLRKSARVPLLLSEIFMFAIFGGAIGGFQLVSDLNRVLDRSPVRVTQSRVLEKYSEVQRTAKRRKNYYLRLRFKENPDRLPLRLPVALWDYFKTTQGEGVEIRVRDGFFKARYIEEIRAIPAPLDIPAKDGGGQSETVPSGAPPVIAEARAREIASWRADPLPPIGPGHVSWAEQKYFSGSYRQREPMIGGKRNGLGRYWHENGQLYAEIPWVNDQKHGCFQLYRSDGTLDQSLRYREGQPHGLLSWHDTSGRPERRVLYDRGNPLPVSPELLNKLASEQRCP